MKRARDHPARLPRPAHAPCPTCRPSAAAGQDSRTFQVSLQGPDLDKLAEYSDTLETRLREIPGLVDVDSTLSLRKPEVQVAIDRDRASDLGIPVADDRQHA